MPDGLTTVTVTTTDSDAPDATALGRTWVIPRASTKAFAELMTERFGQPVHEAIALVRDLVDTSCRDVRAGRIIHAPGDTDG